MCSRDVIETCIKNKDAHLIGMLKKCIMYKKAQNGKLKKKFASTMSSIKNRTLRTINAPHSH